MKPEFFSVGCGTWKSIEDLDARQLEPALRQLPLPDGARFAPPSPVG